MVVGVAFTFIPQIVLSMHFRTLLVVSLSLLSLGIADAADGQPADASPEQIEQWVEQLAANRFAQREEAMQKLIDAGTASIDPIVHAVRDGPAETADRGLNVLRHLGLSDDEQVEDAARAALNKLAAGENQRSANRARNTLRHLNELRQDRAIAMIRKLGGTVEEATVNQFFGGWQINTSYDVKLDEKWQGGVKGLKYIRWLPDLRMVQFRGRQVDNEWVESLSGLEKLSIVELNRTSVNDGAATTFKTLPAISQLSVKYSPLTDAAVDDLKEVKTASIMMLYGTKMTPAGAEALTKATEDAGVRVDYRRGGFLGVGCTQTEAGCTISQIHPNSAAQKEDIRVGDIVTEYAGKPVPDFQTLTSLIGENAVGDKVKIKLRRDGSDELEKELTLGEWD